MHKKQIILNKLVESGVVAVVRASSAEEAVKISEALFSGNIKDFTAKEVEMAFNGLKPFEVKEDLNVVDLLVNGEEIKEKKKQ